APARASTFRSISPNRGAGSFSKPCIAIARSLSTGISTTPTSARRASSISARSTRRPARIPSRWSTSRETACRGSSRCSAGGPRRGSAARRLGGGLRSGSADYRALLDRQIDERGEDAEPDRDQPHHAVRPGVVEQVPAQPHADEAAHLVAEEN